MGMEYRQTQPVALLVSSDPLDIQDILMERIEFEDRRESAGHNVVAYPQEALKKELHTMQWSPTAKEVFKRNMFKFTVGLLLNI